MVALERHSPKQSRRRKGGLDRRAMAEEGKALLASLPSGATLVALSPDGRSMDSDQFLRWFVDLAERGVRDLAFVIGGPDGLDASVLQASTYKLSLSAMTLPHELAEVVLMEQLYRALTRWRGLPYHR